MHVVFVLEIAAETLLSGIPKPLCKRVFKLVCWGTPVKQYLVKKKKKIKKKTLNNYLYLLTTHLQHV
jgi:hypothetical protein